MESVYCAVRTGSFKYNRLRFVLKVLRSPDSARDLLLPVSSYCADASCYKDVAFSGREDILRNFSKKLKAEAEGFMLAEVAERLCLFSLTCGEVS